MFLCQWCYKNKPVLEGTMKYLYAVLLLVCSMALVAEEITLTFMDRDLEWPLEGVMVQIIGKEEAYYSDMNGVLTLHLPDANQRTIILAQLPGYDSIRYSLKSGEVSVQLDMVLSGVVEGEELVVERSAPGKSDEEAGVSLVMDAEEMETTANIGIIEDVMSSVKTLPGVSYTGGWNARPSIRGGDPSEMAAMLDGIIVAYPYHWGGAYSIFNPNMTQSAKLSHGVFSVRYGQAMSGVLEVNSKDIGEDLRIDLVVSTISTELFSQIPLGEKAGLFLGGKVTYMETVMPLAGDTGIAVPPYIRDFYGKWEYRPRNNLKLYTNVFVGTDGVGMKAEFESDEYSTRINMDYSYINSFVTSGAEWAPNGKNLFKFSGGYNLNFMETDFVNAYGGTRAYSEAFLALYSDAGNLTTYNGETSYSLEGLGITAVNNTRMDQGQLRLEWNHSFNENHLLNIGTNSVFMTTENRTNFNGYADVYDSDSDTFILTPYSFDLTAEGNRTLNSSVYISWEMGSDTSRLKGELGVRGENFYLWNDSFDLKTYPTVDPRLNLSYKILEDVGSIKEQTVTLGSGLFSMFSDVSSSVDESWGLEDYSFGANKSFYQTLGTEISFSNGWSFQLDGYYKYFYDRLYAVDDINDENYVMKIFQDGFGYSAGFDLMLTKEIGRKLDGYLSYSFMYTRLKNPYRPSANTEEEVLNGSPLDEWYYPYYHRFHSANFVANWHFKPGWTFTTAASFASGLPLDRYGEVVIYPAYMTETGEYIERYARESYYSDSLRTGFSIPLDLRISYKHYRKGSKWQQEFYFALEDVLANVYTPAAGTSLDQISGAETPANADFSIGIPVPSIGYKLSR